MVEETVMRDSIWGKILRYVVLWAVLFLILCVVSVVKNRAVLAAVISRSISSLVGYLFVFGLILYGIALALRAISR